MVSLFRKPPAEPDLDGRIAGLARRRIAGQAAEPIAAEPADPPPSPEPVADGEPDPADRRAGAVRSGRRAD